MNTYAQVTYPNGLKSVIETELTYRFLQSDWDLITFDGGWELTPKSMSRKFETPHPEKYVNVELQYQGKSYPFRYPLAQFLTEANHTWVITPEMKLYWRIQDGE